MKQTTQTEGKNFADNFSQQMTNISKAHAYDILVEQVRELKESNGNLYKALDNLKRVAEKETSTLIAWDGAAAMDDAIDKAIEALKNAKL